MQSGEPPIEDRCLMEEMTLGTSGVGNQRPHTPSNDIGASPVQVHGDDTAHKAVHGVWTDDCCQVGTNGEGDLVVWGYVTVDRLKWGNEFLKKRMGKGSNLEISPRALRRMKGVKKLTKMSESMAAGLLASSKFLGSTSSQAQLQTPKWNRNFSAEQ
ncbi:Hypothetical predicted protein [Olea europaea subsp. europaea]|uniref:Senescence domain-containing protein n=1 Tax=Olea europaea subsp. europaea TaxID=158383 RepID=A0A8S0P6T2_OLEEU|nr:Hypothetical predicted protein [Olea europaea subsp. europaea]